MTPSPPPFDYPLWISGALRLVARRALEHVEHHGLPPGHHLLVSVAAAAEGVVAPEFLRQLHPREINLVLEHQFWDLTVDDDGFSVTLAFGGSRHRVFAPWPALTAFADPGAQLALRFGGGEEAEIAAESTSAKETAPAPESEAGEVGEDGAEVVRIDRFRRRREDDPAAG